MGAMMERVCCNGWTPAFRVRIRVRVRVRVRVSWLE
jgi:hypothetical protein